MPGVDGGCPSGVGFWCEGGHQSVNGNEREEWNRLELRSLIVVVVVVVVVSVVGCALCVVVL